MKPMSFKLEEKQYRLLEQASKQTYIPKSTLIRMGIDMILSKINVSGDFATIQGRKLGELARIISALPALSDEESKSFLKDLSETKKKVSKQKLRDPWQS